MLRQLFSYLSRNQAIAALFIVGSALILYHLREILIVIFVAYIIVAALNPVVEFLRRRGLPKTIAVLLTFFVTLVFFVLLIAPLVPFFISQIQQLAKSFPSYVQQAAEAVGVQLDAREIGKLITPQQLGQNAFALAGGVFGGFFTIVSTIAISFYLLLSYDKAKNAVANLFSKKYQEEYNRLCARIQILASEVIESQHVRCQKKINQKIKIPLAYLV